MVRRIGMAGSAPYRKKSKSISIGDEPLFLDSIVENIPDMIFVKCAKELRFVRFNRAGEELLGYRREELLGKNDYDFFPKTEADFFTAKDREVLSSDKMVEIQEEEIQTKGKGTRILHTKKIPIRNKKGKPLYLLGISEDITEKRELQRKLFEESQLGAIGRLVAGIAHEIRNPLFGISASAQILAKETPNKPELREISDGMLAEIKRLRHLLDDLLIYSRRRKLKLTQCKPRKFINELIQLQAPLAKEKGLKLEISYKPAGGDCVVDTEQIRQVFLNLLVNAIQASARGDTIRIESRSGPKGWILKVHNRGDWIRSDHLQQIFEPFFTTRSAGTGLGLPITKRIVIDHGGTIDVISTETEGTTFTVTIPK